VLQYKIPQNVGIEDKIVGPFSLRQLIILAIGGGISYVAFAISSRIYELNIIEYILIVLPALFSLALAMLKVRNVSFGKFILLAIEFAIKPKKRIWDHRGISALVAPDLSDKSTTQMEKEAVLPQARKNVNLRDLSAMLDSGGFEHVQQVRHEDIDKVGDDDLITEAYFGHKKKESPTENMYWRTREVQKKKLNILARVKAVPTTKTEPTKTRAPETKASPATPAKNETVAQHLAKVIREARENNQKKPESPKAPVAPVPKPEPPAAPPITPAPNTPENAAIPKKKRRKRKRKPKPPTEAQQVTQVNTIAKTEPVKFINKPKPTEGETSFNDLTRGTEIEFNLD